MALFLHLCVEDGAIFNSNPACLIAGFCIFILLSMSCVLVLRVEWTAARSASKFFFPIP